MDPLNNSPNNCQLSSNGPRMMLNNISSNSLNNNNNNTSNSNVCNNNGQSNNNVSEVRHTYTIPGIVQYLQYEWQRFELNRQQWEVEKSELRARIAMLQGERKGQENLKNDLIRRIKMLEYCLRQERAKYHKLKYGVDPPNSNELTEEANDFNFELDETNMNNEDQSINNWKQGRQLLRHYLQEIGYTDTIIDVRSNRVRSLLGLVNSTDELTSEQAVNKVLSNSKSHYLQTKKKKDWVNPSNVMMMNDAESSVLATFEFLNNQSEMIDNLDVEDEDSIDAHDSGGIESDETEDVLNEFDMILNKRIDYNELSERNLRDIKNWKPDASKAVDIGELASLTETNNVMDNIGRAENLNAAEIRKTWSQKYILKSHYDCIRALRFHATEPLLITASDDETLKLWNLNRTQPAKGKQQINTGNATFDLEPIYTYRGHSSTVLSLCVHGNVFYSGSQNGEVIAWSIPSNAMSLEDSYDPYDSRLLLTKIIAHTDAVWSLTSMTSTSSGSQILITASADKSIKIWDTTRSICLKSIESEENKVPTDLAVIGSLNLNSNSSSSSLLLSSFSDGSLALYDIESHDTSPVLLFENVPNSGSINSMTVHPTMPIVITAHQYRLIKLWDINNGKCIHSMVAHLDEVTSIDCDPNGLYILSGSHDCSVRLWNFDNKNCVQEIMAHRKKFDEAIFHVTFHPTKPFFASAGADGLAKVFV